jgi:hypothetical protein
VKNIKRTCRFTLYRKLYQHRDDWRIHSHEEGLRAGLQFQETRIVELFIASFSQTPCLPYALSSKLFIAPFCFIFLFTDQVFFISNGIKKNKQLLQLKPPSRPTLFTLTFTFTFRSVGSSPVKANTTTTPTTLRTKTQNPAKDAFKFQRAHK